MLALEVIHGTDRGCVFPLPPGEPQLIGRSSEALPLTDRTISRRHAELTPDSDHWFLRDLSSSNGTRLNGAAVTTRTPIEIGDEIECGSARFRVIESDVLRAGPVSASPDRSPPPGPLLPDHDDDARRVLAMFWSLSSLDEVGGDAVDLARAIEIITAGLGCSTHPPGEALTLAIRVGGESRTVQLHGDWTPWRRSGAQWAAWLVETLDAARRVGERDRLAAMGRTVAAISHAVKNILQGLQGGAGAIELAIERGDLDLAREGWPILSRNLDRIHDLTFNMLAWSRTSHLEPRPGNLDDLVGDVVALHRPLFERRRVALDVETGGLDSVPFDAAAMHQAVLNLLVNALEAAPARHGHVTVTTASDDDTGEALVAVQDDGPGIEPERHAQVFEPFASTRGQRGTGLGLAVTRRIMAAHGGRVTLESSPGRGARFELRIPMISPLGDPGDTDVPPARGEVDPARFGP